LLETEGDRDGARKIIASLELELSGLRYKVESMEVIIIIFIIIIIVIIIIIIIIITIIITIIIITIIISSLELELNGLRYKVMMMFT
jgi:hypothetical protein